MARSAALAPGDVPPVAADPERHRPGLAWPLLVDAGLAVYLAFAVRGARNGVSEPSLTLVTL